MFRELEEKVSVDDIYIEVDGVFSDDPVLTRNIKIYLAKRYSGKRLKEIGKEFGIGESGVSQTSRRLSQRIKKDNSINKNVDGIIKKLNLSRVKT